MFFFSKVTDYELLFSITLSLAASVSTVQRVILFFFSFLCFQGYKKSIHFEIRPFAF